MPFFRAGTTASSIAWARRTSCGRLPRHARPDFRDRQPPHGTPCTQLPIPGDARRDTCAKPRGASRRRRNSYEGGRIMKIAFATQDLQRVDAHFGWAKNIAIYDVTPEGYRFVETFTSAGTCRRTATRTSWRPSSRPSRTAPSCTSRPSAARVRHAWWPTRSTRSRCRSPRRSWTSSTSCRTCSRARRRHGCARRCQGPGAAARLRRRR